MRPVLDPDQASAFIGAEPKTLANWRCQGIGPAFIRVGRKIVYDPADIEAWKASNRFQSTSEAA